VGRVVIDNRALAELLRSPNGPGARFLIERAEVVKTEAKRLVGVKTGTLRSRITKRFRGLVNGNLQVDVVADTPYAIYHHEGTKRHTIRGNPVLSFYWPKKGRRVYVRRVRHPGTKPNPFLARAVLALKGR